MTKINLGRGFSGQTPRSKGGFLILDRGGEFIAQSWPKPRGKAKTPYDFYKQQEFMLAGRMASSAIAEDQFTAWEMTKGTQQVPRDFITMCIFGTCYELVEEDGFVWPTFRAMSVNPQYVLDLIGNEVGAIIYRAEIGWIILPPGNGGQVLTMVNGLPQWLAPSGGSAGISLKTVVRKTTNDANTTNTSWVASFNDVILDELSIWNPATPDRLAIPADYTRYRFSWQIFGAGLTGNNNLKASVENDLATQDWFGAGVQSFITASNAGSPCDVSGQSPWMIDPQTAFIRLRFRSATTQPWAFHANTALQIEAIP